ncbi:MAG: Uma2 family endonuclease [Cyanobacteriota bacterium]|jgi:Uma2 family endonuclease
MVASSSQTPAIIYPDSDGQPMADNTLQFEWIVTLKENLELLFAEDPQVFIAGDLLWYPLEGNNTLRRAPDAMVVFGRPKGYRGSYQQWLEGNIAPQVVFEILSPSNRLGEMAQKFAFYQTYGVEEYYIYDPHAQDLSGWLRRDSLLAPIEGIENWVSPRLQIRFELLSDSLKLWRPDGQPFLTFGELDRCRCQAELEAERAKLDAQQAQLRAISAEERAEKLAAYLRSLGVNPEEI